MKYFAVAVLLPALVSAAQAQDRAPRPEVKIAERAAPVSTVAPPKASAPAPSPSNADLMLFSGKPREQVKRADFGLIQGPAVPIFTGDH